MPAPGAGTSATFDENPNSPEALKEAWAGSTGIRDQPWPFHVTNWKVEGSSRPRGPAFWKRHVIVVPWWRLAQPKPDPDPLLFQLNSPVAMRVVVLGGEMNSGSL